MPVELTVDQIKLKALQARLKAAGEGGLKRELNRGLKEAAQPIADDEKATARALPVHGQKSTGLRDNLANAVTVTVSASKTNPGVKIRIPGKKMPANQKSLPRRTSQTSWRHPVFGHDPYVSQTLSPGWFPRTARKHKADVTARVHKVMDDIAKKIAR